MAAEAAGVTAPVDPPPMDLVYQAANQTLAHRATQYFHTRHQLCGVPMDFARDAFEVGPHTNRKGPGLGVFRSVALSHDLPAFREWWDASPWLQRGCARLIWVDGQRRPAPTREALTAEIAAVAPLYAGATLRLHVYPRSIEMDVGDQLLPHGYDFHPVQFTHVLYAAQLESGFAWSIRPRGWLWGTAPDKPSKFAGTPGSAVYKLDEALQVTGTTQRQEHGTGVWASDAPPSGDADTGGAGDASDAAAGCAPQQQALRARRKHSAGSAGNSGAPIPRAPAPAAPWHQRSAGFIGQQLQWACDLGASPGTWTGFLAAHCSRGVVAIDPAYLAPEVVALPKVHHLRMRAQEAVEPVRLLLDGCLLDLLACDMNMHPGSMKDVVMPLLPLLRPGGLCVLTLKFCGLGRDKSRTVGVLHQAFEEFLEPGVVVWLIANTENERCYIARRRGDTVT